MPHPLDLHPLNSVAQEAWDASKQPHQPPYADLDVGYRSKLLECATHASDVTDEHPLAAFARRVLTPEPEPPLVAEIPEEVIEELKAEVETEVPEHQDPKGQLPDDFPSRAKLHEAAINTYGQLAKVENLTAIEGIGPETVKKITKRLKAETKVLNK